MHNKYNISIVKCTYLSFRPYNCYNQVLIYTHAQILRTSLVKVVIIGVCIHADSNNDDLYQ